MINFRKVNLDSDYSTLQSWWRGHGSLDVPREILPRGWIAEADGVGIATSFLYVAEGKIAVIEWTTTNPQFSLSPDLVRAVKGLYELLEKIAKADGCLAVISFVDPDSWERRTMAKMGYVTSGDSKPHLMFCKSLKFEHQGGSL